MAVNLLSYLSDQFSPAVTDQLGQRFNETPANTRAALTQIIPTVLAGLAVQTHSLTDAGEVVEFLRESTYSKTGTPLDIAQVAYKTAETQEAIGAGGRFIDRLIPTRTDEVARHIADSTGVNRTSALGLMSLVGAVLEGVLGRQSLENGLTPVNLSTLVAGQLPDIRAALPGSLLGLASVLGFSQLSATPTVGEAQQVTTFMSTPTNPDIPKSPLVERERENVGWLRWAMIAVGALVLFLIIQKCRQPQSGSDGVYTDTTARAEPDSEEDTSATTRSNILKSNGDPTDSVQRTGPAAYAAENAPKMPFTLPGGRKLTLTENSFNANLAQFLAGKTRPLPRTFTFSNLTFDTNSAKITSESQPNVNDLIEIMNAYPTLQITVQGHTDNTGDPVANKKLSLDRASAVRAALVSANVAAGRVTAQGFGAEKPAASNDNEEGRAKNRRIDVVIEKL